MLLHKLIKCLKQSGVQAKKQNFAFQFLSANFESVDYLFGCSVQPFLLTLSLEFSERLIKHFSKYCF